MILIQYLLTSFLIILNTVPLLAELACIQLQHFTRILIVDTKMKLNLSSAVIVTVHASTATIQDQVLAPNATQIHISR